MKKKLLSALLATAMTASMLAGCGSDAASGDAADNTAASTEAADGENVAADEGKGRRILYPGLHRAFAHQTRRGAGRFLSGLHGGACQKRDPRVRQNAHRLRLKRGQRRHYLHRGPAPRQTGGNT